MTAAIAPYQAKDYKSDLKPIWCPGCGDFSVVQGIYRALAAIAGPDPEDVALPGRGDADGDVERLVAHLPVPDLHH